MSQRKQSFGKIYKPRHLKASPRTTDESAVGTGEVLYTESTTSVTTDTSETIAIDKGEDKPCKAEETVPEKNVGSAEAQGTSKTEVLLSKMEELLLKFTEVLDNFTAQGSASTTAKNKVDGDNEIPDAIPASNIEANVQQLKETIRKILQQLLPGEVDGLIHDTLNAEVDEIYDNLTKFYADKEEKDAILLESFKEKLIKEVRDIVEPYKRAPSASNEPISPTPETNTTEVSTSNQGTQKHSATELGTNEEKPDAAVTAGETRVADNTSGEAATDKHLNPETTPDSDVGNQRTKQDSVTPSSAQDSTTQTPENDSSTTVGLDASATTGEATQSDGIKSTSPNQENLNSEATATGSLFGTKAVKASSTAPKPPRLKTLRKNRLDQARLSQIPLMELAPQASWQVNKDEELWKRASLYYLKLLELEKWKKIPLGPQSLELTCEEVDQGRINQKTTNRIWKDTWDRELERRMKEEPEKQLTIEDIKGNQEPKTFYLSTATLKSYSSSGEMEDPESLISFPVTIDEYGNLGMVEGSYSGHVPAEYQPDKLSAIRELSSEELKRLMQSPEANSPTTVQGSALANTSGNTNSLDHQSTEAIRQKNWLEYLEYIYIFHRQASHLLQEGIKNNQLDAITAVHGKLVEELYLQQQNQINATKYLESLIRNYLSPANYREDKTLVRFLGETKKQEPSTYLRDIDWWLNFSMQHYGSPSRRFPLAESQRRALHSFINDYDSVTDEDDENYTEADGPRSCISTISGPPGTGKTTLISSVLAQKLVEHAIEEDPAPFILASAVTNQALVNILESFQVPPLDQESSQQQGALVTTGIEQRFLPNYTQRKYLEQTKKPYQDQFVITDGQPDQHGFCFTQPLPDLGYFVYGSEGSIRHRTELHRFKLQSVFKDDSYARFSSPLYISRAKSYFLKKFNEHIAPLCQCTSIVDTPAIAKRKIHELIRARAEDLESIFDNLYELGSELEHEFKTQGFSHDTITKVSSVFEDHFRNICDAYPSIVQAYLSSQGLPFQADQLITHLWQEFQQEFNTMNQLAGIDNTLVSKELVTNLFSRYLIVFDSLCDITYRADMYWLALHYYEARWLQFATPRRHQKDPIDVKSFSNLFPVAVGTVFNLPRLFCDLETFRLKSDADLLIVDEAGQAPVHQAIPCLDMAKHALIVGDSLQLQPVEQFSKGYLQKLSNDYFRQDEIAILESCHLTGYFGGSLMSVAAKMSGWKFGQGLGGLMLTEHYRCYPEIIQFCSELFYNNALVPQRPSAFKDKANPQPDELPLDYFLVERSRSKEVGTSKTNYVEALAIKKWLDDNSDRLQQRFKDKIGRSMQLANIVTVITQYEKQALVLKEVINSETKYKHIRVGTVNTMQGSERPVVLFSSVYGENAKDTAYIDTNTSVFNVAVSRAKNQFILFGCAKHLFGKSNVFNHFKQAFLNQSKSMPDDHVKKSRLSLAGPVSQPEPQNQTQDSSNLS